MTKPYLEKLQIEANVPDLKMFHDYINLTVDFEIICPNCGVKRQKIKKNGHDIKLEGKPQIFYCKTCSKSFFAHTSWIFKKFTNLIIEKVVNSLFIDNLDPKSISKIIGISSSTITKIRYQCFDLLSKKVSIIRSEAQNVKKFENLPLIRQSGIWWDETFFKINGSSYSLILIINALGRVLGYKFSKTRNENDYLSILNPILDKLPELPIFICDGAPTYEGVVKSLKRRAYVIQHIHSHPWKNAKLRYFEPTENGSNCQQTTIILPYDSFLKEQDVIMSATSKYIEIKEPELLKNKRGRPKGKKDTKKRLKYGAVKNSKTKQALKQRGRKNLEDKGAKISFCPDPYKSGWNLKLTKNVSKRQNLINPDLNIVSNILKVTFDIMDGGAIQSNFIESKNSAVKRILPKFGLKNVYQYDYLVGTNLLASGDMDKCYWDENIMSGSFNKSLGFSKMLMLFAQIELK
jgi:transposase-like protein